MISKLDEAMGKATDDEEKGKLLLMKALIVESRVKDNYSAFNLFNDFLTSYADHPLADVAKNHQEFLSKS